MGGYQPPRPGGSGGGPTLETNGTPNGSQALLNLAAGAGVTLADNGTGTVTIMSSGGGGLSVARIVLNAVALDAINSTPVVAIAAPGANKAIRLMGAGSIESKAGTTAFSLYSGALTLRAYYENSSGPFAAGTDIIDDGLINSDQFAPLAFTASEPGGATTLFSNKALVILAVPGSQGRITASVLADGGALYAPGDTFTVDTGIGNAAGVVDTVDGGGAVLTYHLTAQGTAYTVSSANATTATTGIGTGLTIDITGIQTVSGGDGSVTITLPYIVIDL